MNPKGCTPHETDVPKLYLEGRTVILYSFLKSKYPNKGVGYDPILGPLYTLQTLNPATPDAVIQLDPQDQSTKLAFPNSFLTQWMPEPLSPKLGFATNPKSLNPRPLNPNP